MMILKKCHYLKKIYEELEKNKKNSEKNKSSNLEEFWLNLSDQFCITNLLKTIIKKCGWLMIIRFSQLLDGALKVIQ